MMMEKAKFGMVWKLTDYCYSELSDFIECSSGVMNIETGLRDRYHDFLRSLMAKEIKKSTEVDFDVMALFIGDLDNRAQIDYFENQWPDDPYIARGGAMFWNRCQKLRAIHPTIKAA